MDVYYNGTLLRQWEMAANAEHSMTIAWRVQKESDQNVI